MGTPPGRLEPLALFLLTAGLACSSEESQLFLLPPAPPEGARSAILIHEARSGINALAFEDPTELFLESPASGRVTVLYYREPLGELGLEAGSLLPTRAECSRTMLPPGSAATYALNLDLGASAFEQVAALPETLQGLRVKGTCPCRELEITPVEDQAQGPVRALLSLGEEAALVIASDRPYRLSREGSLTALEPLPFRAEAATMDADGRLWLGGAGGALWSGLSLDTLEPVSSSSDAGDILDVLAPGPAGTTEVVWLSKDGFFERFDGEKRTVLYDEPLLGSSNTSELTAHGAGKVVGSREDGAELLWYDSRSGLRVEPWPTNRGGIGAIGYSAKLGVLIATRAFRLFAKPEGEVMAEIPLGEEESYLTFNFTPRAAIPLAAGFLLMGANGRLAQFHPGVGFCESIALEAPARLERFAWLGDVLALGGALDDPSDPSPSGLLYLVRIVPDP